MGSTSIVFDDLLLKSCSFDILYQKAVYHEGTDCTAHHNHSRQNSSIGIGYVLLQDVQQSPVSDLTACKASKRIWQSHLAAGSVNMLLKG